jgi:hypothetical protein
MAAVEKEEDLAFYGNFGIAFLCRKVALRKGGRVALIRRFLYFLTLVRVSSRSALLSKSFLV